MDKNELEQKKALKRKALDDALLKTVNGGALPAPGPVNFICTFDPNPNLDPINPKLP